MKTLNCLLMVFVSIAFTAISYGCHHPQASVGPLEFNLLDWPDHKEPTHREEFIEEHQIGNKRVEVYVVSDGPGTMRAEFRAYDNKKNLIKSVNDYSMQSFMKYTHVMNNTEKQAHIRMLFRNRADFDLDGG